MSPQKVNDVKLIEARTMDNRKTGQSFYYPCSNCTFFKTQIEVSIFKEQKNSTAITLIGKCTHFFASEIPMT